MRLWLLRHAKSAWDRPDIADHDRTLAPRGEHDAERMRRFIEAHGVDPATVLCSSAARARQTLELVAPALSGDPEIVIEPELYTFDASTMIARLRALGGSGYAVMVVGHNPAIHELTLALAGSGGSLHLVAEKYPTCSLAEIEVAGDTWAELELGKGELIVFVRPRDLD